MKKILALLLAMIMLCSVASADMVTYNFTTADAPFQGVWCDISCGFMAYLPSNWYILEIPADMASDGVKGYFGTADGSCVLAVYDNAAMGSNGRLITDYDTLYAEYTNAYAAYGIVVNHVMLNGQHVLAYDLDYYGESGLLILDGLGVLYTVAFAPNSNADYCAPILFSTQPMIR